VLGIEGLAPYGFDVDAAAFVSHKGDCRGDSRRNTTSG
jgi:uncharacterized protein involved in copper resistance